MSTPAGRRARRLGAAAVAFVVTLLVLMLLAAGTGVTVGSVEVVLMFALATIVALFVYRRGRSSSGPK